MDRLMVYPGAIPLDTDVLSVERNVLKALGWMMQATLGTNTGVVGLPCTPTVPASMNVNIGPGAIWAQEVIDQNNFGSLPADESPLMKMGILAQGAGVNFTLTAPNVSGESINYLIEASFVETDTTPVVLPYVNPANPAQPYTGPDNSGTPQNTVRTELVNLQLKAGTPAPTGSQTTPAVDVGYVGLYVITVNYGQTTITSADITQCEGAPFNSPPFAALAGNANQPFSVGPATQPAQAPQLGQVNSAISSAVSGLAEESWVQENFAPIAGDADQAFAVAPGTGAQALQAQQALEIFDLSESLTITPTAYRTVVIANAAEAATLTLNRAPEGCRVEIYGNANRTLTVDVESAMIFSDGSVLNSFTMPENYGAGLFLTSDGGNWHAYNSGQTIGLPATENNQFTTLGQILAGQNLAIPGSIKLLGGLILQWGQSSIQPTGKTSASTEVTLPVAFPNMILGCLANTYGGINSNGGSVPCQSSPVSTSQINVNIDSLWTETITNQVAFNYLAWGF